MTPEEIDKLEACHGLDLLVAKVVMGCKVRKNHKGCYDLIVPGSFNRVDYVESEGAWASVPHYSTEIAAAWEVIEKLRRDGIFFSIKSEAPILEGPCADTSKYGIQEWDREYQRWKPGTYGETAPEVICKAALKAVGWNEKEAEKEKA